MEEFSTEDLVITLTSLYEKLQDFLKQISLIDKIVGLTW